MSAQPDLPNDSDRFRAMALVNYGHFTSMRVAGGRVRGLARHLERLDRDARVVFGRGLDEDRVRAAIRAAVAGVDRPVAARVTAHAPGFDPRSPESDVEPEVVVTLGELPAARPEPLRVRTAGYQRDLPQVKHVGTFGLFYQRRLARAAGFDDVLFVTPDGQVSEGSTWNVCFLDGDTVVWPSAPALPGISMGLVQSGLLRLGAEVRVRPVLVEELPGFRAAFATNALSPVRPISHVDDTAYQPDDTAAARLLRCHDLTAGERV
ncbi:aminotransferase class IV [Actinokineospora sp. NBRC 105648]|uniref:aminotransferase class IV n=1 Tax=Actinokineospora sp. NBRC 105648 TaxID=3032206 RepID=UPI0025531699|nr:aminotransferase class IV [Actinokineospora sp. NBRC 105648]